MEVPSRKLGVERLARLLGVLELRRVGIEAAITVTIEPVLTPRAAFEKLQEVAIVEAVSNRTSDCVLPVSIDSTVP